jgi:ribosome-associated protein
MPADLPVTESITLPGALLEERAARSGGPGGQSVNTSETRVQLRFHVSASDLPPDVKARLAGANPGRMTRDGWLVLACDSNRSRHRNTEIVRERLAELVRAALIRPEIRRDTKPTWGSKIRRLDAKGRRSKIKSDRGSVDY